MEEKNSEKKERKMRDSGIPWIGEVPEGWGIHPLYSYFAERKNKNSMLQEQNLLSLSYGKIIRKDINTNGGLLPANFTTYNIVQPNDVVIRPTDLQNDKRSLRTGLVTEKGIITSAYISLQPITDIYVKYFHYLLHSYDVNKVFYNMGNGVRQGLNYSEFSKLMLLCPEKEEQHRIADFLDSKCSEIDTLIENLRARMESVKEYKKAVITEAVTKGLDKDVKMKDSGIEWIGEIPEGWSFPKITHILDYTHPYPIGDGDHGSIKATDYTEYGIPFIRVQNLGFATDLCLDNVVYISEAQNRTIQNSTLKPNDILFAKTGATIGKVGIVPESIKKANTTSHVGKITVSESIVPKYIFYVLSSNIGYRQFWDIAAQKSTRPELSIDEIKTIRVLLPKTKEEQQQIADYLDSKCSEIDALLQNYEDQIATLEEYKKSLIYEYVTGKKEVSAA